MVRIYHPWHKWEDYRAGFYDNCTGETKQQKEFLVVEMFSNQKETTRCMFWIVNNWKYSCEHNLTNSSMNKIAYIGQAACCYYGNIPSTITMSMWSKLPKNVQESANSIAEKALNHWIINNKNIQLCLNID